MSERNQPSERLPKDPVRIVYHAENRTFARLFNERSLDEVKDVVRRKLGLGRETDVSLKQMGSDALLDLEDDDDFQAFRVLLGSSVSVDIQVTVGMSRGSTVPLQVAPQPREQPSVNKPTTTSLASPSRQPARSAASGVSVAHPEVAPTTQTSATPIKRPGPSARKRKVSFDDAALAASDKPAERRTPKKVTAVTPVAPAGTAESPAAPKPIAAEEPPKKKQKKEATKAKDVQPTEAVQSSPPKVSDAPKRKTRKSAALDRESEAGTNVPKDAVTPEPPAKVQRRRKKDDDVDPKKSSASVDRGGLEQPMNQPNDPVDETFLQPEQPKLISLEDSATTRKSEKIKAPKGTACAAIPRTSASTTVQSEVAAAILSRYLSKASETVPPEPPAKRKYVRKVTTKSSAASIGLPVESTTVLGAPANEVPNVPTEHRLEHVVLANGPLQQTLLNSPPCPICLGEPFHIRYCCPTVLKGPDAIRERLEELMRTNTGDQQSLIKELEGLLRDLKVTSKPSFDAASTDGVQSREALPLPNASLPRTPTIPSNSYVSEVTVESRGEGSSSESSDDMSEGGVERKDLPAPRRQQTSVDQPAPANDDLEAVIRGPTSKRQSVLNFIDRIVEDKDDEDSDSEEDEAELEEDPDEEIDRSRHRSSMHIKRSSDSESEDEESRSSSPSRSAEGVSNNLQPGVQGSNKPAEESAEHPDGDTVMRDSVDPPVLEGDGSSEETHVGSEDRMDVDHESIGEKRAATIVEQQTLSPARKASVLPPSDVPGKELRESGQGGIDPASNRDSGVPVASEAHNEVEADPIEPADDLEPPAISRSSGADPIEAPSEDIESLFTGATQSTPKPGVTKRIKTRHGQIPDDEAERPVLLEQLATEATDEVTPLPAKGKSRRKTTEMSATLEPAPTRKSPRFSSLPPATSTPAAVVLLNHRSKAGARIGNAAKTPAKRSGERSDALQSSAKDDAAQNGARIAPTPSTIRWETLTEPSSPSLRLDEPSVRIDELMSSSPHPDNIPKGRSRKPAASKAKSSQRKERLFDLSSSQIPFPYSQYQNNPAPTAVPNGKEREDTTDSEEEPKASKKKAKTPAQYRSLSHLASHATTLFSPSLPTPGNKSVTDGKTKKRVVDEDSSSSSSSSSDAEEATGSEHIPRGRRAGSVLETRKKKKSLLSRS